MAIKSLVSRAMFDEAGSSHDCRANSSHRIHKGDVRLKVKDGRNWLHYCVDCAANIIKRDKEKLDKLTIELTTALETVSKE